MSIVNNIHVIQENIFFEKHFIVTYQGRVSFPVKSKALSLREKCPKNGVISGPYFPVSGLNTEIYCVNLRIQFEYMKIRSRNNSVFWLFSRSVWAITWSWNGLTLVHFYYDSVTPESFVLLLVRRRTSPMPVIIRRTTPHPVILLADNTPLPRLR